MITFYPGPSKIYKQVKGFLNEAFDSGILSVNHRSSGFMELYQTCIDLLQRKLNLPEEYSVYFVSSATECWEIIAQSFIRERSFHLFNGAFGEKWFDTNKKLGKASIPYSFLLSEVATVEMFANASTCDLLALTQNETSNGTQIRNEQLAAIRSYFPDKLIAIDATSSMAGVHIDFSLADIWYASVQKCFGLPSGLALLICSSSAVEKGLQIGDKKHYNSFNSLHQNMLKFQTTHTPNILDIYLLSKVLESIEPIETIDKRIKKQATLWYSFLEQFSTIKPLTDNNQLYSDTVITVNSDSENIKKIKELSLKDGITIGNGYGAWKTNTFRIANFPAIEEWEIEQLKSFLQKTIT